MTSKKQATEQTRTVRTPPGGTPTVYSNQVQVVISPWDLRFIFAELEEATAEEMVVTERVRIAMSPAHARAFLELLSRQLDKYEGGFGPIHDPIKYAEEQAEKGAI